jgi:hypothetical protein
MLVRAGAIAVMCSYVIGCLDRCCSQGVVQTLVQAHTRVHACAAVMDDVKAMHAV